MDLQYCKRRQIEDPGQAIEDGDFIQLREVRKKKKKKQQKFMIPIKVIVGCQTLAENIEQLRSELFQAVSNNDDVSAISLIANLKVRDPESLTSQAASHPETKENIWHFALSNDKKSIVKYLLENEKESLFVSHYEINRSGIPGKHNALHILTEKKQVDIEMVKNILSKISTEDKQLQMLTTETGVDIQGQRPRLLSCLHLAAYHGHADLVELFLDIGMDVNHKNEKKDTALLWAARWGHVNVVESLLDRNADPEKQNDKGSTALYWAIRYEHVNTVKLLLTKGKAKTNTRRKVGFEAPLVIASAYGNNEIVKLLLEQPDCDVNIQIRGEEKPIHHAAREGYADVISTLIDKGAGLNVKDGLGDTPLLHAAQNGHADLVCMLINRGANIFHTNNEGHDVWYYALKNRGNNVLEALQKTCLNQGAAMIGRQPLYTAADNGQRNMINFVLNLKKDPLQHDVDGNTFLHVVAMNDEYQVIEKFIDHIDTQNETKNTPLHIACSKGSDRTITTLLKWKARADVENSEGEIALHAAAYSKHIKAETVKELIAYFHKMHKFESLNAQNNKGKNCLHIAGKHAEPDVIWEFRCVELKDRDDDGKTPLHEAVRPGRPECLS